MAEEWKPVVWFEGYYEVSSAGRVRNVRRGNRLLRGRVKSNGFREVGLSTPDGRVCGRYVHLLVADAFLGPGPAGHVVNHRDDNRFDNSSGNLEFITPARRDVLAAQHGRRTPGYKAGEKNVNAKLTAGQVRELRALRQRGWSIRALATHFDIAIATAHRAATGRCWATVGDAVPAHFVRISAQ